MAASMEENELTAALVLINVDLEHHYHIKKKVMETMLYSVYIISTQEKEKFSDRVLLIHHPPATECTSSLMPIELEQSETTTEIMKKIVGAIQNDRFL